MSIFSTIFGSLWSLIKGLFTSTEDEFNKLPLADQAAAINGVQLSQLLKDNFDRSEAYVIELVASKLGVSPDVAKGAILYIGKQLGVTETTVKATLDHIGSKIGAGIDDIAHNSLFKSIAEFAAFFFSGSTLNWITISLGIIEYAYQWLKGNDKLDKGLNTALLKKVADDQGGDPVPVDPAHPNKP